MTVTKAWAAPLDDYVIDLDWSADGRLLAAASAAGAITLFDATGVRQATLPGHADGTNCLAFEPMAGSAVLASGGQDGTVRFWNAASGQQSAEAVLGSAWIEQLAWCPRTGDQAKAAAGMLAVGAGRELVLLRGDASVAHKFPAAAKTLSALAWHPGSGAIAAASFGKVALWDSDDFQPQRTYDYPSAIATLVWSPDGRWLVAGAQDNAVHLWLPEEDQEFHMSGYETKVRELSFSRDGRWLATGGARDACVWDCAGAGPEGREPAALPHSDRVCAVAFQRRGSLLATAAIGGEADLWTVAPRENRVASIKLTASASRLAWSPDDSLLAIGSQSGGVLVLKVAE